MFITKKHLSRRTVLQGVGAVISLPYFVFRHRSFPAAVILVGFLTQYLPWARITRVLFLYHMFGGLVFMILALAFVLVRMQDAGPAVMHDRDVGLGVVDDDGIGNERMPERGVDVRQAHCDEEHEHGDLHEHDEMEEDLRPMLDDPRKQVWVDKLPALPLVRGHR